MFVGLAVVVQPFEVVALGGMVWHSTGLALMWFNMPQSFDKRGKAIRESRVCRTFLRSNDFTKIGSQ